MLLLLYFTLLQTCWQFNFFQKDYFLCSMTIFQFDLQEKIRKLRKTIDAKALAYSHNVTSNLLFVMNQVKTGTWAPLSMTMSSSGRFTLPICPASSMRAITTSSRSVAAPRSTSASLSNALRNKRTTLRVSKALWKLLLLRFIVVFSIFSSLPD